MVLLHILFKTMYANLHVHTVYSVLDSLIGVSDAFSVGSSLGYTAIGITEHANMSSIFLCLNNSIKYNLKLVPGIEFNFIDDDDDYISHLVVLASNYDGLYSLFKVCYNSYCRDLKVPYIKWEDLDMLDKGGVFVLSGCKEGILARKTLLRGPVAGYKIADRFLHIFKDKFIVEYTTPYDKRQSELNSLLRDVAKKKGIRDVVTTDSHYLYEDQQQLFQVLQAVQRKGTVYDKDSFYNRHPLLPEDSIIDFMGKEYKSAVFNSTDISDSCEDPRGYLKAPDKLLMPKFDVSGAADYVEFLKWKADNGL